MMRLVLEIAVASEHARELHDIVLVSRRDALPAEDGDRIALPGNELIVHPLPFHHQQHNRAQFPRGSKKKRESS